MPPRTWKVGRLAAESGLTVRMLHHWDAIGLLSPSRTGSGDHREYGEDDVGRLYLIVALRELGLDLAGIKACLDAGVDPRRVMEDHLRHLDACLERLQRARNRSADLLRRLPADDPDAPEQDGGTHPCADALLALLRELGGADPDVVAALPEHLDDAELARLAERARSLGPVASYLVGVEWPYLYRQADGLRQAGAAPDDPRVLALARRMVDLSRVFGDDEAASRGVREAWRRVGPWEDLSNFVEAARAAVLGLGAETVTDHRRQ